MDSTPGSKKTGPLDGYIAQLEPYFTVKAPVQLPPDWRDALVRFSWILALIGGFVLALTVVGSFGGLLWHGALSAVSGRRVDSWYLINTVGAAAQMIFLFMAAPGLKERRYAGWKLALYAQLVNFSFDVLRDFTIGGILGALMGLVVSLFLFYQVKHYFHQ